MRRSISLLSTAACATLLAVSAAQAQYTVGSHPTIDAPPGEIWVGDGLGLDTTSLEDLDLGVSTVADVARIVAVTVISPSGESKPFWGDSDWTEWLAPSAGLYHVVITLDDPVWGDGAYNGDYADDDEVDLHFTLEVRSGRGCQACNGNGLGLESPHGLHGVLLRFNLGKDVLGEPVGHLVIDEDTAGSDLATSAVVKYEVGHADVEVILDANGDLRQLYAPQILADIVTISSEEYHIRYFLPDDVGSKSGGVYQVTAGNEIKKWVIETPTGSPPAYVEFDVTEYVDGNARVRYEYYNDGDSDWTLTTVDIRDSQNEVNLRVESVEWVTISGTVEERRYIEEDGSSNEVYRQYERYTEYSPWGWRRTQLKIDPSGANLTTDWTYSNGTDELARESGQGPEGGWTWYEFTDETNGDWTFEEISGWKDQRYVSDPAETHSGVNAVVRTYDGDGDLELALVEHTVGGNLVGATEYERTYYGDDYSALQSLEFKRYQNTGGTSTLDTKYNYYDGYPDKLDSVEYPDGRRDDHEYDEGIAFTPQADPLSTTPTYNTSGEGPFVYRAVINDYDSSGTWTKLNGETIKKVTITYYGRPVFSELWVYSSGWTRLSWTAWIYDGQYRLKGTYHSNGTSEEVDYSDCCTRTVTDATGVDTEHVMDPLGRIETITREAVASYYTGVDTYPAVPAVTTSYDYDTASEIEITVSSGTDSRVTTREYDNARRLVAVTTGSGSGALKTMYDHGTRQRTVYYDYATSAASGTSGERDQVTTYYRDGQVKDVTGSTVVGQYYTYGTTSGESWTRIATGSSGASPRYEKTYYDMLGRLDHIERPGWVSSGSTTLTTTYDYDTTTGQLTSIEATGQPDTLFEYDELGNRLYTALDLGATPNGQIDLNGVDRVTKTDTAYVQDASDDWWRRTETHVYATDNSSTATDTGSQWTRTTGFSGTLVAERKLVDASGEETLYQTDLDATQALVTESVIYPDAGSSNSAQQVLRGRAGQLASSITKDGLETWYTYNGLGYRTEVTDSRGNTTETHYDASWRVVWVEDEAANRTEYGYYGDTADNPGKLHYVENPADKRTYYAYNDRGAIINTWGHVPQPSETTFNAYGERTGLKTYQGGTSGTWTGTAWPATPPTADETNWTYDAATGLLEQKEYTDDETITYTYTVDGRLGTRTNARGVGANHRYDSVSGQLVEIDYDDSDVTHDVEYAYDRLGRIKEVTDAAGTRTLAYDADSLKLATETFGSGAGEMFGGRIVTRVYESSGQGTVAGRFSGIQIGTAQDADAYYAAGYEYDSYGRIEHVTGPGLHIGNGTNNGAWYTYENDSRMVSKVEFKNAFNILKGWTEWTYDADRDMVTSVENIYGNSGTNTTISEYSYGLDADLDRWSYKQRSGSAFSSGYYETHGFNDRGEFTASGYYTGTYNTGSAVAADDRDYAYDSIGNRTTFTIGDGTGSEAESTYAVNQLNQYPRVAIDRTGTDVEQGLAYDDDGNVLEQYVAGDMNCDGDVDFDDIDAFTTALSGQATYEAAYPDCRWLNADCDGDGDVDFDDIDAFTALSGTGDGMSVQYTWDAENRLIGVEPLGTPADGDLKSVYTYDYMNRRIRKTVCQWDSTLNGGAGGWDTSNPVTDRKFMYADWLLLAELDANASDAVLRTYTWGLDLAGQRGSINSREGAGGIGGLLAVHDAEENDDYIFFHDANGNVGQVVNLDAATASASMMAKYEYTPYGTVRTQSGDYAEANPMRFSTKYWDDETGLGYWGERYYNPTLGRWMSRDPIGEWGGENLYRYVDGNPVTYVDPLGWSSCSWSGISTSSGAGVGSAGWPSEDVIRVGYVGQPPWVDEKDDPLHCGTTACKAICHNDQQKQPPGTTTLGVTSTDADGNPCYCACGAGISHAFKAYGETAQAIIAACIAAHEKRHLDKKGANPESDSTLVTLGCIAANIHMCQGDSDCLRGLRHMVTHADCSGSDPGLNDLCDYSKALVNDLIRLERGIDFDLFLGLRESTGGLPPTGLFPKPNPYLQPKLTP